MSTSGERPVTDDESTGTTFWRPSAERSRLSPERDRQMTEASRFVLRFFGSYAVLLCWLAIVSAGVAVIATFGTLAAVNFLEQSRR